ncbi:MAG: peptidoglycan DD-metalloendopeptidase family protein [Parcubacteria group bacterium]|nr:peptidoglycan DD-metalloendopeptidase family protein [Parcubacteria group bacterium]
MKPNLRKFVAFLKKYIRFLAPGGAILLLLFIGIVLGSRQGALQSSFLTAPASAISSFSAALDSTRRATIFPESPELLVFEGSTLAAATPPVTVTPKVLGAIVGTLDGEGGAEIAHYVVEEGDTVASLAEKFEISTNTILWANDIPKGAELKLNQELTLLPVSGVLHAIRPNETLGSIASLYQVKAQKIAAANNLDSADDIFAGDLLVIPGGSPLPVSSYIPLANSYFIYPIPVPHYITQGLHPFNAIDFSNGSCGESVFAAAGGIVQKIGYSSIGGNYVRILHPNGVVTYYGHLSSIGVSPGLQISQGGIVGYTGNTGYTIGPTGCHVHFEVRGAENPFRR